MIRGLLSLVLLTASNVFMTTAWYFHLRQREAWSMLVAIGISWLIALPEYCLQVPANRIGHVSGGGPFTTPQLKVLQEAITLSVFSVFAIVVLKDKFRVHDVIAFGLIFAGVLVSMMGRQGQA